jgi:hypothetical protein
LPGGLSKIMKTVSQDSRSPGGERAKQNVLMERLTPDQPGLAPVNEPAKAVPGVGNEW